jgi:membrane protease subunit (stomatin/prohibitin family)
VKLESLNLPDELQQRLDERIGMTMVGDLGRYTQFQTGRAIPLAAAAEGGAAGAGVGVGAGVAMGQAMAQTIGAAAGAGVAAPGAAAPAGPTGGVGAAPAAAVLTCPHCRASLAQATRFCPECGQALG